MRRLLVLGCLAAVGAPGGAGAEIVARGAHDGLLALGTAGTPAVAYVAPRTGVPYAALSRPIL